MKTLTQIQEEPQCPQLSQLLFTQFSSLQSLPQSRLHKFQQSTPKLSIKKFQKFSSLLTSHSDSQLHELTQYTDTYKELETLGQGFQSICKKVSVKATGELRVAKINCLTLDEEMRGQLKDEGKILKKLGEGVMRVYEQYETSSYFIQIVEFIDGESFETLLKIQKFNEQEILAIAYRLLITLKEIHQQKIIHRDITLSNILYNKRKNILKLIDFGIAKQCNEDLLNFSQAGNKEFKAPEMLAERFYNEKIDLWGLGLVLYSLVLGKRIGSKRIMHYAKIEKQLEFPEEISDNLRNLICGLLEIKKKKRLSAEEALQLPLFQQEEAN